MSLVPFEGAIEGIVGVINKFIPDTAQRDAAKAEITTLMLNISAQSDSAQADIDKVEASGNWFQSCWRPLLGWSCALTFCGHYVFTPTFLFLRSCWQDACTPASYDLAEINTVLYALLGIGSMRTIDKGIGAVLGKIR